MIETTYIPLAKAAEMLGAEEVQILIAGAERRIQLYWLLNEEVLAECWGLEEPAKSGEKHRIFCMFAPISCKSVAAIIKGGEFKVFELLEVDDESEEMWTVDDHADSMVFPANKELVFAKLKDIQDIISNGLPKAKTVQAEKANVPYNPRPNTLLATVAALLACWPKGKLPSGKELEKAAQLVGVSVSDDSILKVIERAKEIGDFPTK